MHIKLSFYLIFSLKQFTRFSPRTMSRSETEVEVNGYIDTAYSSGDYNNMKSKQHYREENNNEVDELSKDFTDMGCIVDAVKRPPNICIETCVYEESVSGNDKSEVDEKVNEIDEAAYSDEFEEDNRRRRGDDAKGPVGKDSRPNPYRSTKALCEIVEESV